MHLISVNIGRKAVQENKDRLETTGIYKTPGLDPVEIKLLGIEQDFICDLANHGGEDQALYCYCQLDYQWWSGELGRELEPGTFGENLTISDLESAACRIGDRLRFDQVVLEVTAPRIPCSTLAARMRDPHFVKKYRYAVRPGFYCRVLRQGSLRTGEQVEIERYAGQTSSIGEIFQDYFDKNIRLERLQQHLRAPLAIRLRETLEAKYQALLTAAP